MKISDFLTKFSAFPIRFHESKYKGGRYGILVNGLHPIPIYTINKNLYTDDIIPVRDDSEELAFICLHKGVSIDPSSVSDIIYAAYINDLTTEEYGEEYIFKNNYIVVLPNKIRTYYKKYRSSSLVWGGFDHLKDNHLPPAKRRGNQVFKVIESSNDKHEHQYFLLSLAESQPYSFERYLRYYHCLEYIFEWNIVEKIKKINNNLDGYTDVLRDLSSKDELERLRMTISPLNISSIQDSISEIFKQLCNPQYFDIANEVLFEYGKETNPLKGKSTEFHHIIMSGNFDIESLRTHNVSYPEKAYEKFICYIIYRIRCCIAHTKLSEYVLSPSDEPFVADFAEPLIRQCLKLYFTS